ncbi:hypothetical protein ACFLYM_01745 [Chloroflexota bacterium]
MKKHKWNRMSIISVILISIAILAGCITVETSRPGEQSSTAPGDKSSDAPSASQAQDLPVIMSFSANPGVVPPGEEATLSWDVAGADSISIEPKLGYVSASGNIIITPKESTVYTLTATNKSGDVTVTTEVKVAGNEEAMLIALTVDDVKANGFVFQTDRTPPVNDAVSTYSITFIKGEEILNNSVYIFPSQSLAQQYYYGIRSQHSTTGQDIYTIREQKAFVVTDLSQAPDKPEKFWIRFTKSNVYVELGSIYTYKDLENYALLAEARIK